jgi:hypothetical protein
LGFFFELPAVTISKIVQPPQHEIRCPQCGQPIRALRCNRCGSRLPIEQADLYGAVARKLTMLGGNRADTTNNGGRTANSDGTPQEDRQNTQTPPSLCRWISERLADAGVHPKRILDPCAGQGNLTRPFPGASVIEFEVQRGADFFAADGPISCGLGLCNPPWKEAERWLRHLVKIVGNRTPLVFICPALIFISYKDAPFRTYLTTAEAPVLNAITPLPQDTFVGVYTPAAILWMNLPEIRNVALVPNEYLIRKNN